MKLDEYRKKRDFTRTREPAGGERAADGRSFVVQKHAARALHYDFRLELDGVLLSWAVPKGPSRDPKVKRLAMQTEDHPVAYGGFEGVIPKGEYGGGSVIVWDRGIWEPEGDPREAYRRGRLTFELHGDKLRGRFHLVRTAGRGKRSDRGWLLFKSNDAEAQPGSDSAIVDELPNSVLSGRSVEEVEEQPDRVWSSKKKASAAHRARTTAGATPKPRRANSGAAAEKPRRATTSNTTKTARRTKLSAPRMARSKARPAARARQLLPDFVPPELATLVDAAPEGDDWLHEMKLDGYRILARIDREGVTLQSRRGNDWTSRLPSVAKAVAALGLEGAILDGELVVLGENGVSNFQRLQNSLEGGKDTACTYFVFDVLFADGEDLRAKPLSERKELLAELLRGRSKKGDRVRLSEHVTGGGATFFERACKLGLEGIVSKRAASPYESRRSRSWLKVKCLSRQEFVIGGYTEPSGSRSHFGALLLGVQGGKGLEYAGKVGTGFTGESLREIAQRMKKLERKTAPFVNPPRGYEARGVHWLEPSLVGEVEFTERTDDGHVRHATFRGLRDDKPPADVHAERAEPEPSGAPGGRAAESGGPTTARAAARPPQPRTSKSTTAKRAAPSIQVDASRIRLTHPERVLYPDQGLTKADLALYYAHVAHVMLPHVVDRPLTLVRCPEGAGKECFFQKHPTEGTPDAVARFPIKEKKGTHDYMVVHDAEGLIGLVQVGALEIHTWGSRTGDVEKPDQIVFDLDPDTGLPWANVVEAAVTLRARLDALGLTAFLKTTGGKGLHLVVPVAPDTAWEGAKAFTKQVVDAMVADEPRKYLSTMTKEKRKGKIFLDYFRNARGATAVCAFSTRARAGAPVSVPLAWEELTPKGPLSFDVRTVPERLARLKTDPWADFDAARAPMKRR
jgi:bifunctional non-homologous end joining protein LigD